MRLVSTSREVEQGWYYCCESFNTSKWIQSPKLCYIAPSSPPAHLPKLATTSPVLHHFHDSTLQHHRNLPFRLIPTKQCSIMSQAAAETEDQGNTEAGTHTRSQCEVKQGLTPSRHRARRNSRQRAPTRGFPIYATASGAPRDGLQACDTRYRRPYLIG
jgi:hypothetical protein